LKILKLDIFRQQKGKPPLKLHTRAQHAGHAEIYLFTLIKLRVGKILGGFEGVPIHVIDDPLVMAVFERGGEFVLVFNFDVEHLFSFDGFSDDPAEVDIVLCDPKPLSLGLCVGDQGSQMLACKIVHLADLAIQKIFIAAVLTMELGIMTSDLQACAAGGTSKGEKFWHGIWSWNVMSSFDGSILHAMRL
jgi:hypothetical protein